MKDVRRIVHTFYFFTVVFGCVQQLSGTHDESGFRLSDAFR